MPFALPRRAFLAGTAATLTLAGLAPAGAAAEGRAEAVLMGWYRLLLELIRHTATYSPPVAARSFAYLGITVFEALASGDPALRSLAGQVSGLRALPERGGSEMDDAAILQAALSHAMRAHFGNTGPTGQRAMDAMDKRLDEVAAQGILPEVLEASRAYGLALSGAVLAWSADDGGAVIANMGFPYEYKLQEGPAHWVPTSTIAVQQTPLLPGWGGNRGFVLPATGLCDLAAPLAFSEDPGSAFYKEALEVYEVSKRLTEEEKVIARFWSDDPMLSPTPPGHWVSIALEIFERDALPLARRAEVLAILGIAISDAFIVCWRGKFAYDLVRPITYIRRLIDPGWEPLLITPPFPEYPSGHSTQSGAAATAMEGLFGADFAFDDATHEDEGLGIRSFTGFGAAAAEAAVSRLYGGIHYRRACETGLIQGACVGKMVLALQTRAA